MAVAWSSRAKPIVLISTNNYWEPFDSLVDRVVENGFAHGDTSTYYRTVSDPASAVELLTRNQKTAALDRGFF